MPALRTDSFGQRKFAVRDTDPTCSHQFLRNLLLEYFFHRQRDDDLAALTEEGVDFGQGVRGEVEGNEEALGAVFTVHDGFEGADIGAAGFVFLFDLDRIPKVHEIELAGACAGFGGGGDGEDSAVDAHIADLGLVGDAAEGDDGPVFEFERGHFAELFFGIGKLAHDEAAIELPESLVLLELANVAEALGHDAASGGGNVDADPLAVEVLGGDKSGAAAAEGVEDDVVGVAAGFNDAVEEGEGFLGWVAEALGGVGRKWRDIGPNSSHRHSAKFVCIPLEARRAIGIFGPIDKLSRIQCVKAFLYGVAL